MTIPSLVATLRLAKADASLSPLAYSRLREAALIDGLLLLAADFGVTLQKPVCIDANGELPIIATRLDDDGSPLPTLYTGCAPYGDGFAQVLSKYRPRTGASPASSISGDNGWCYMNHFDVEQMLTEYVPS